MTTDKLFVEIRAIVAEIIEVEEEEIQGDTKFREDLDVDSMKALEILVAIEKKYKVKIDEGRLKDIKTLNDSVGLAREYIER